MSDPDTPTRCESLAEGEADENNIACPFCKEKDFDLIGLKSHLTIDCLPFTATETLPRVCGGAK